MSDAELYQPDGNAWNPQRADLLDLLRSARHVETRPIYYGSNHTFLVTLESDAGERSLAVYKPARGEYPLYDFPAGSLFRREIATWCIADALGWSIVPPTVATKGRHGTGSLQLFIDAVDEAEVSVEELRRIALLDVIVNNADRKAEHCLPGKDGRLWAIDHGLTLHDQPKLRTVLWHFAGSPLTAHECSALDRLRVALQDSTSRTSVELAGKISRVERAALLSRLQRILALGAFPDPRHKPVPYRW